MGKKVGNLTIYLNVYRKDQNQPGFRGKMDIGDKNYEISLWENTFVREFPVHLSRQVTEKEDE